MIYYNDTYYEDIEELLDLILAGEVEERKEDLKSFYPDGITVQECKKIPLHQFTEDELWEILEGSCNWPEDSDRTEEEVSKAIKKHLPALNADMPTVWMATKETTDYSLEELLKLL